MPTKEKAIVEPALLTWARESAHFAIAQVAKKAQVKPQQLESWEAGSDRPTVKQLRKLAKVYKRSFAVFYLPEPPTDFKPLKDFRRFPGDIAVDVSPELSIEMRFIQQRREIALELLEELGTDPQRFEARATLDMDAELLGERTRKALGISLDEQLRWNTYRAALNAWRQKVENAGILVFQLAKVDPLEVRGFSVSEQPCPLVVINRKDTLGGRMFTLLHELTHVMMRSGGVCDILNENDLPTAKRGVEVFCNRVAGATLVPAKAILGEAIVSGKGRGDSWTDREIEHLVRRYKVGRETMLRRLLILDKVTTDFYEKKREQYKEEFEGREKESPGFISPAVDVVSVSGRSFVRLVFEAFRRDQISANEVSNILDVRTKHFGKIEALLTP